MDSTTDNDYFELEPYDQYKPQEAKFQASLKWLFTKAYDNSIPKQLDEPFFEENELGKSLRNDLVRELIDGQVYCAASKNIFNNASLSSSHQQLLYFSTVSDIFDHLAINSISVTDENDDPVTQQTISQDSPFYVSAHLALIDCLMRVYASRMMSFESTINAIKNYTNFDPNTEAPFDLESTIILWLNKITITVLRCLESECELYGRQSSLVKCQPHMHLSKIGDDLSGSLANGTILAVLLIFYTCDLEIDLSDVSLQEIVGFEESVENLNLVKEFCDKHLPTKPFCFNFEDFLYSPGSMKINKLAFIAELFYSFETQPVPNLVKPNHFNLFKDYMKRFIKRQYHVTTPFISARISDVTRNSFIKGSYTPPPSIQTNELNNPKPNTAKKMSSATNGSFNSLLDNVFLDQSQNFEDVSSSSAIKSSNDSNAALDIKDETAKLDADFEYHPMFTSRTYVKTTSPINRLNLNQSASNENNKTNQSEQFKTAPVSYKSPDLSLSKEQTPQANSHLQLRNSDLIKSDQSNVDSGMKTIRLSNNNLNQPKINSFNDLDLANNSNKSTQIESKPDKNSNEIVSTQSVKANETETIGLVRRPSVTARPGDIFYKVKDVTESSTTDMMVQESNNVQNEEPVEPEDTSNIVKNSIPTNKSYTISTNNDANRSPHNTSFGSLNRKTTTWNVKRNQTTSLGICSLAEGGTKAPSQDDSSDQSNQSNDPNSNTFNKELLSIRMQLKEKKSSMERDKRKLESELEKQRQTIGKQVFLQVVQKEKKNQMSVSPELKQKVSEMTIPKFHKQIESTLPKPTYVEKSLHEPKIDVTSDLASKDSSAPRRQWDKSQKGFIDLENESPKEPINQLAPQVTNDCKPSSISSLSTPPSSASQSPPNARQQPSIKISTTESDQNKTNDISKAYYSRDEMMKTIEVLKSTTIALASKASNVAAESKASGSESAVKDIDTELQKANSKLSELQNEIARLSLLQQQQQQQQQDAKQLSDKNSTNLSEDLDYAEEKPSESEHLLDSNSNSELNEGDQTKTIENQVTNSSESDKDGAFFISFENGSAKREKPPTLTPKKNLFIKTSEEKARIDVDSPQSSTNSNLLMTAVTNGKQTITKSKTAGFIKNVDLDDGEDLNDSELKQRKKELIIQKQLERRQQQELIRQQREEERARKNEEYRLKEEEAANKKALEKNRKETIFQAYIDKKKQLQDESHTAHHFGGSKIAQTNLVNAKKYHSTYRIKSSNYNQQQNFNDNFNDQASVISDRSSNVHYNNTNNNGSKSNGQMIKTYSSNNLYQSNNYNNNNNNNHHHHNGVPPAPKRQSRVSRPPSCARPTISSLRKMNRTFSLNNVSDVGLSSTQKNILNEQLTNGNSIQYDQESPKVVPLTQASLAAAEQQQARMNNPESESMMRMTLLNNANKLGSKYASSNYLSDYSTIQNPQKTRTTPRRRTPRNAEEFLTAAGIQDPDEYVKKGYYVGSMLNLNELTKSSPVEQQPHMQPNFMSQQFQHQAAPVSSSSSSSTGGFQKNQNQFFNDKDEISNSLQRRNSVHEPTSISMANLNFLNNNFNTKTNSQNSENSNGTGINSKTYFRNKNGYGKQRSATTAIIDTDHGFSLNENRHESTTTTGSSAPSSDSSSSPNPHHARNNSKQSVSLGPLMSAVTKLETDAILNSPRSGLNGFIEQRFFNNSQAPEMDQDDDFDEYEFLERNLGADPPFTSNALLNQRRALENNGNLLENTTTNTNVTDYYTDESNSCNNDTEYPQFNSSKTLCNTEEPLHGQYLGGLTPNSNATNGFFNINNINVHNNTVMNGANQINGSNNNNCNNHQTSIQNTKPSPRHQHVSGNGWDQASVVSNNSLFSANRNVQAQPRSTSVPVNRSPKLFKRLTGKTNKLAILNSLNHRVLAGVVNAAVRKQVIEEIEASDERHFIILFRDYHLQYRAIYSYTSETDYIEKVVGTGPQKISEDMVETYFKYNSGGRQFTPVPTKHFSVQCDGVSIHSIYWSNRKASNPVTNLSTLGAMNSGSQSTIHNNYGTARH